MKKTNNSYVYFVKNSLIGVFFERGILKRAEFLKKHGILGQKSTFFEKS